ncbi:MAG: ModD protein [Campylobacterales bacterium]
MKSCVDDATLSAWLKEDAPEGDLTTRLLGIGPLGARMIYRARAPMIACGMAEVARMAELLGAKALWSAAEGISLQRGDTLLSIGGNASALHLLWRVGLGVLERACAVATATRKMVDAAKDVNESATVLTTRKHPPGLKPLMLKAVITGGANPHRLGLSESILVFAQHRAFLDTKTLQQRIGLMKQQEPQKRIAAEAHNMAECLMLAEAGAEFIQLDKAEPAEFAAIRTRLSQKHAGVILAATGGIHAQNAADYVRAGALHLITSWPYQAMPAEIGVEVAPNA